MRLLLDTNILIPLENSQITLDKSLAHLVRLAGQNGHQLLYHPASEDDINRDCNLDRRCQTLDRLAQYTRIQNRVDCPWNTSATSPNDAADNEILYALFCDAAHALVTEDREIHRKAKTRGLVDKVHTIQTAHDWLRRLHETTQVRLPNIEDRELASLTPLLGTEFFESLRDGYPGFDSWFRSKARNGEHAWVTWEEPDKIGALCVYATQKNERVTEEGLVLEGPALKLCTFKVGASVRGQKIGELFLKAAFRYATANRICNIFIHGDVGAQQFLFEMLETFGFERVGTHPGSGKRDDVYVKKHPVAPPNEDLSPFDYFRRYFPHFRTDSCVSIYVVPIQPQYHHILFPDYESPRGEQLTLFKESNTVGNAIKLAYLCNSQVRSVTPGDVVLFYRSRDERAITSIGVVEQYETLSDADAIATLVKRRTVYSMDNIRQLAVKPTRVMLFRLVRHLKVPRNHKWLQSQQILKGPPQSITRIRNDSFPKLLNNDQ